MSQTNEPEKVESQPAPQPAGEARGSDLTPQEQGGSHLPDISEPTGRSLSEQFESGPGPTELAKDSEVEQPAEEPVEPIHKCSICNGPDYQGCGCEAKALQKSQEQEHNQAGSRMDQELDPEDAHAEQIIQSAMKAASNFDPSEFLQMCAKAGMQHREDMKAVLDRLSDINSNLEILVSLQQNRVELLKDLQNGKPN